MLALKIELFDIDEFIELNHLKEVTSQTLFEHNGIPNPNGLISNEIFGVNVKDRKETFAYIDLHGHFLHPHIYKILKRIFRNIDKIINGEEYYRVDSSGALVKDPMGETGIEFLYNNWKKIKWNGNGGMSSERAALISKTKLNEAWMSKYIVIPAFYRDIHSSQGGGGKTSDLNNYYTKLIRMAALLQDRDLFDISFHSTNYNIQNTIVGIYDYFKDKLDKKTGLFRKYLMGKNVDYCGRVVISAPVFNQDRVEDNIVNFENASVPIAQVCVLFYPFMVSWLRNFFEGELIESKYAKWGTKIGTGDQSLLQLKNPEAFYTDKYIKKHIDMYVDDPSSRYDRIEVPTYEDKKTYLIFQGRYANESAERSGLVNRFMTWTDLLFIASNEIVQGKHIMVTRYPLLDNFGEFLCRIRVSSTINTVPMDVGGHIYKWYPDIDLGLNKHLVSNNFIDTMRFSNSYLKGLDGDYDGDQITAKGLWSQEANEEAEELLMSKRFILGANGKNIRIMDLEGIQTLYALTKEPVKK